ncbi:MAG: TMEM165/GDT1 family protein [Deltaproteobacteria bacterium]|nr:TMEM165/GDT1 family protein [Deltaproteobacteria bacterium]
MDWKLITAAFGSIFLAELGDKTQLAVITLVASSGRPWSVFLGASAALVSVTLLGVAIGAVFAEVLPLVWLRKAGALAFVAIGLAMLFDWL